MYVSHVGDLRQGHDPEPLLCLCQDEDSPGVRSPCLSVVRKCHVTLVAHCFTELPVYPCLFPVTRTDRTPPRRTSFTVETTLPSHSLSVGRPPFPFTL